MPTKAPKTVELTNLQGEVVTIATPRQYNPGRVVVARAAAGLTQGELAKELGLTRTAISGWEAPRGTKHARTPDRETLGRLADLLCPKRGIDYFYGQGSPL